MPGILDDIEALTTSVRAMPEKLVMSTNTMRELQRQLAHIGHAPFGVPSAQDGPPTYKGIELYTSDAVPDGQIIQFDPAELGLLKPPAGGGVRGAQASDIITDEMSAYEQIFQAGRRSGRSASGPFSQGDGRVMVRDDDGQWKEISQVRGDVTERAELSALWKTVEAEAAAPEEYIEVALVDVPAWLFVWGAANADELGVKLWLVHEIKPTTGGDRYHKLRLEAETSRGTAVEEVHWTPGMKRPQPSDWHVALRELGLISDRDHWNTPFDPS
jgi:hypothetical protein